MNAQPSITGDQVKRALDAKGVQFKPCPMCSGAEYETVEAIYGLPGITDPNVESGLPIAAPYTPLVAVVCKGCTHVSLFGAEALGLTPKGHPLH